MKRRWKFKSIFVDAHIYSISLTWVKPKLSNSFRSRVTSFGTMQKLMHTYRDLLLLCIKFSVPTCCSGHQRTSGLLRAHKCVLCADIHLREEEVACHFVFLCYTHLKKKKKSKATIDLWIFRSEHNLRRGNIMQHNIGYITEHT